MKSITINGSQRESVGKKQQKPYVMLDRFLAYYTEANNQYILQQQN